MDEQPSGGAPPVVAVVVTRDPGPWLEEALAALGSQDYPNLSILVIDAASAEDPTRRVAAVAPSAYVRRLDRAPGYAAAANEVLSVVEGASHFLLCHDDVAPDPGTVRHLVEEAFRSNAGIVGPKLVLWDHTDRLLAVGLAVDKLATPARLVERGELDQEQHDAVRDVFAVPGACMLVRADLFATVGGFAPVLGNAGEDVDLCWRAQIAGARVVFCPDARVRHLEAGGSGQRGALPDRTLATRNRLRTILANYGVIHLVRVLPQAAVLSLGEALFALVTGDIARVREVSRAWTWNIRHWKETRRARKAVHESRVFGDGEVRRLQLRGFARLSIFLRAQLAGDGAGHSVASVGRGLAGSLRQGSLRLPATVFGLIAVFLAVGSRRLVSDGVPAVGQLAPFPDSAGTFLRLFFSGWRTAGLGSAGSAPPGFALLGVLGWILAGGTGLLRQVLVLGAIPVGAIGAYRLARPFGGRLARLSSMVVYLAIPVPYNALATGRWQGLVAYAAAPFVLRRILAATALEPFGDGRPLSHHLLPLAVLLGAVAVFAPMILVVVLVAALGLLLGSVIVGGAGQSLRAVGAAAGSALIAVALLFPWSIDLVLPGAEWSGFAGVARPLSHAYSLGDLLRFDTGPIGTAPLGWGFLVAAALPLLIGKEWRLAWAARLWSIAITCWAVAWACGRGWIGVPLPVPEVLLATAAAAVAMAVALGVLAFVTDLPGYSFGVRQVVTVAAAAGVALGALPVLAATSGGRWRMPANDDASLLAWMPAEQESGAFRVLWVGSPDTLPLPGWRLSQGVAYATSRNGAPNATDLWPPPSSEGATRLIARALNVARRGRTTRLGHMLGTMGVRYVVLPARAAPGSTGAFAAPPADVRMALQDQLDLRQVPSDPSVLLYENVAWAPARGVLPADAVESSRSTRPETAGSVELAGTDPVLQKVRGPQSFSGPLAAGDEVLFAESRTSRWRLSVAGKTVHRRTAFGWANAYSVERDGTGVLHYRTPVSRYVGLAIEALLWVLAIRTVIAQRRRRRTVPDPAPTGDGGDVVPVGPAGNGDGGPASATVELLAGGGR